MGLNKDQVTISLSQPATSSSFMDGCGSAVKTGAQIGLTVGVAVAIVTLVSVACSYIPRGNTSNEV